MGDINDYYYWEEENYMLERDEQLQRLDHLIGEYIVIYNNRQGNRIFLKDKNIYNDFLDSKWTGRLANAMGFKTEDEAYAAKKELKYSGPRVAFVEDSSLIKIINRKNNQRRNKK